MIADDLEQDAERFSESEAIAARIEGWLLPSEVRFLALAAAHPTAQGSLVELGSFHGKSTAVLARASERCATPGLVSVDPFDPPERSQNLLREGVASLVDYRRVTSEAFWRSWDGPIRMLWHDGANERETVRNDVASALPHLSDGAVVAFHDVRNPSGERLHIFCDDVLSSPHFGASGVCGTIGWSQYRADATDALRFRAANERLRRKLNRLRPFHDLRSPRKLQGFEKIRYKALRWFVPHGAVTPQRWSRLERLCA